MNDAAKKHDTAMYAVLKLDADVIDNTAKEFDKLYAVNFNCPGQTVVSGLKSSFEGFEEKIKSRGGRLVPLAVSAAFHSPFMNDAADAFAEELKKADIKVRALPLYSNMTAEIYTDDEVELLSKQICNPVKWENIIRNMIADGIDTFIEIGPGKTLTNMIKKIDPEVTAHTVMDHLAEDNIC